MRYIFYVLAITLFMVLLLTAVSASNSRRMMDKLSGTIEIIYDFDIQRITFPSGNMAEIFKKNSNYIVASFDVSTDGKNRIMSVSGVGYDVARLVMYSNSNVLKTILSKNSIITPSFSPDGKTIAYLSCPYDRETKVLGYDDCYLFLVKPDGSSDRKVLDTPLMPYKPSWFPDGKRLVVTTRNFDVYIVNIESGEKKKIIDFGIAPVVSHDGKTVAYLSNEVDTTTKKKIIDLYNIPSKDYEEIMTEAGDRQKELMKLGQYFLEHSIYLHNIETGKNRKITERVWIEQPAVWSPDDKYVIYNDRRAVVNDIFVLDVKTGEQEQLKGKQGRVMVWRK